MEASPELRGWVWFDPSGAADVPLAWRAFFGQQTFSEVQGRDGTAFRLACAGLPVEVPAGGSHTLLEEMAWALVSRPHCDLVVYPLYVSTVAEEPTSVCYARVEVLDLVAESGFVAMCRPEAASRLAESAGEPAEAVRRSAALGVLVETFSRALLDERTALTPARVRALLTPRARLLWWVARRFTAGQKAWLKRQAGRVGTALGLAAPRLAVRPEVPLARRTSWEVPFPAPRVAVRVEDPPGRVPVWIAMHWLKLGGAEKFAVDLIRALPKDRFAVYVTTDVPAEHPWTEAIRGDVEEVLHLSAFLPPHMVGIFAEHYVATRRVRLLHIHHAPRVYESLFHLRRFHPELRVLHTLHIIELPPHSGGYPEWTMAQFGVFIDRHHVVSAQLKKFLVERWLVAPERVDVVRLHVDAEHFDPARVPRGTIRQVYGIPAGAVVVGFIGRFTRQKRPLEFVRMAALLHGRWRRAGRPEALHFVLIGGGELRDEVEDAIRTAGLDEVVHVHGEIADTRPAYRDCDVVAMPSENEGLALVTYEAMAMGVPVFFTDVGAQSELLDREFLVDPEGPVAATLAERMWPYLVNPDRRRAVGAAHRATIVRRFPARATFDAMLRVYDRLLHGGTMPAEGDHAGVESEPAVEIMPVPPALRGPRVAVAVVTYNHKAALLPLLELLDARGIPTFVTENACSDGTREALRGRFAHVSVLESPANLGGCGGFNCAILAALSAGSEYVLLLDDDALPVGDCIERLARFLDTHREYVFAAPAVYMTARPDTLQEAGGGVDFSNPQPIEAWYRFHVDPQLPPQLDIDYASALCLMVRAEAIMRLGVMDWNYFIFSDDVDWSLRLQRAFGAKAACVTTAKVLHDFPWGKPFAPMRLYFFQRNGLYLLSRLREGRTSLPVLRAAVVRLLRAWWYARLVGDREIASTLRAAFRDAWQGRWGKWQAPIAFPSGRRALDADWFRQHGIRRVLVDITIEDVDANIVRALQDAGGMGLVIDLLCDGHRVEANRRKGLFAAVIGRERGGARDYWCVRRRGYDLVVTDAAMDPRRPTSTAGRHAAFFHGGTLYGAAAVGAWSCIASMAASFAARVAARFAYRRFRTPPPPGKPPADARAVLERIGVDPRVGAPWARDWYVPFAVAPIPDEAVLRVPGRSADAGVVADYVPPVAPPCLEVGDDDLGYREWCTARDAAAPARYAVRGARPVFSLVVVGEADPGWLAECIASVRAQTHGGWQLLLPDGWADSAGAAGGDPRVQVVSGGWRGAAGRATGDYLVFIGAADLLDPFALAALAGASDGGRVDVLYADEDAFDEARRRRDPVFKPDYSPDRLLAADYVRRPVAIRRPLAERLGGPRPEADGWIEYDLLLRAVEVADRVVHVPDVLYHVRRCGDEGADGGGDEARRRQVVSEAIGRRGLDAEADPLDGGAPSVVVRSARGAHATVSVIVADEGGISVAAVRALWPECECLIAPSGAGSRAEGLDTLARQAAGDVLVVASSAVRPAANWRAMVSHALRSDIGLVGGKLVDADGHVYAAGLVLGVAGAAGRWHHGWPASEPGYGGWLAVPHEVSALPWQLMVVARGRFLDQGGFDVAFGGHGFEVDMALRMTLRLGVRHLCLPMTGGTLVPGYADAPWSVEDFVRLWERWGSTIRRGDPYHNANLSRIDEGVRCVSVRENALRMRGAFAAYDRCTAARLAARLGGHLAWDGGIEDRPRMDSQGPAASPRL